MIEGIIEAEASVILPAQRAEIEKQWNGPKNLSTGISAKSIKKGKVKKDRDGRSISIYPQVTRPPRDRYGEQEERERGHRRRGAGL